MKRQCLHIVEHGKVPNLNITKFSFLIKKQLVSGNRRKFMKVLYIDGVGAFGGACRSLYESVRVLKTYDIDPYFLAAKGTALTFYSELASDVIPARGLTRFDNTQYSFYQGVRWIVLLRELAKIPFMLVSLIKARFKWRDIEIIHINEITEIIPGLLARLLFKVPLVVHVRSVQRNCKRSLRCKCINWLLSRVDAVIAIDNTVKASLPSCLKVTVVHNSFTPNYSKELDLTYIKKLNLLDKDKFTIGFVGNLLKSKGLLDLLEAAKIVCGVVKNAQFLIVGGSTRDNKWIKTWLLEKFGLGQDIEKKLLDNIRCYGLENSFLLLGKTNAIQRIYERIDVLCFPSHFDAPGRPIFEAAFSGKPSIAAIQKPESDTFIDGQTGLVVPPSQPIELAKAILFCINNPQDIQKMGVCARDLAKKNCDPIANARKILSLYQRILHKKTEIIEM